MATPGKRLDDQTRRMILRMREQGVSVRTVARAAMVSQTTVAKIAKKDLAK